MEKNNLLEILGKNSYPGRGIVLGRCECGECAVIAYWIMGRSENSRNRIFSVTEDGIKTEAFDPGRLVDPSLIIYHPVREYNGKTIVTNGDQTDTIFEFMKRGEVPEKALKTREFEPDDPNFTPRISGVIDNKTGNYMLSILKSNAGDPDVCLRNFFNYANVKAGEGHYISTYTGDGNPLPSFEGEPIRVSLDGNFEEFSNRLWDSLNKDNKVSLFTQFINLSTGGKETKIYNKNK